MQRLVSQSDFVVIRLSE